MYIIPNEEPCTIWGDLFANLENKTSSFFFQYTYIFLIYIYFFKKMVNTLVINSWLHWVQASVNVPLLLPDQAKCDLRYCYAFNPMQYNGFFIDWVKATIISYHFSNFFPIYLIMCKILIH